MRLAQGEWTELSSSLAITRGLLGLRSARLQRHWPDQARRPERRICPIGRHRREGDFLRAGLRVSNQAVDPEVRHADFEFVLAGLRGAANVKSEGRMPSAACGFTVH
jgi:hypothetical protein